MPTVDFHNHYYPPEYVEALRRAKSAVRGTYDEAGNPCVHYPGDYNILVPGHRDIDYREQVLVEHGVDTQVITFTTPGVHVEPPVTSIALARQVNDALTHMGGAIPYLAERLDRGYRAFPDCRRNISKPPSE